MKWPPCSNLQISQSRFHQIVKKGTFLNSTRKGQLKNVQDGISRRLGSREIQETKVGTVLPDTLYKGHLANLKSLGQADLKTLRFRTYHFGLRMYQRTFCHHINFWTSEFFRPALGNSLHWFKFSHWTIHLLFRICDSNYKWCYTIILSFNLTINWWLWQWPHHSLISQYISWHLVWHKHEFAPPPYPPSN